MQHASIERRVLCSDLLQKLRSRERERQRLQRQRTRTMEGGRRTLSYDAPPFYMASEGGPSSEQADLGAGTADPGSSSGTGGAGSTSNQRRQLGDRLYPKVQSLQAVSQ